MTATSGSAFTASALPSRLRRAAHRNPILRMIDAVLRALLPVRRAHAPLPAPPAVPAHLCDDEVQLEGEGFGRLLGRQYIVRLRTDVSASTVFAAIAHHLSALVPDELAAFEKTTGASSHLEVGDEFDIQIFGPWNGRVRVIEVTSSAFTFVTLKGHPEAGRIRFAVATDATDAGVIVVGITSWARCRDAAVELGYDHLGIGKRLQTTTWTTFLDRVVVLAAAQRVGMIDISEQEIDEEEMNDAARKEEASGGVAHDVQNTGP